MASRARNELSTRLNDVDELIMAHRALTGGGLGRPRQRQGAAVSKAGVVLLAAATEAFAEDLFEEAAGLIFDGMPNADLQKLFRNTSKRLNNADVHKMEMLFFNIGMPWALLNISWRKFSNATVRTELNKMIETRGSIAHGRPTGVRLQSLRRWKNMIEIFASKLEDKVALHIEEMTGKHPGW